MAKRRRTGSRKRSKKGQKPSSEFYTLDKFSLQDLRSWKKVNRSIAEYHIRAYHELEAQRQLYKKELNAGLRDAVSRPLTILRWPRMVDYQYSHQPLSAAGSIKGIGGRFNIGRELNPKLNPFHALYFAEDAPTAFHEYFGMSLSETKNGLSAMDLALTPTKSFASIQFDGVLQNVLDATSPKRLKSFCEAFRDFSINPKLKSLLAGTAITPMKIIPDAELLLANIETSNWRELGVQLGIPSNSQVFGRLVFEAGYDGIVYRSSRLKGRRCACIFLENLMHSETTLSLSDSAPTSETICQLNSETWPKLISSGVVTQDSKEKLSQRLVN